MSDTQADGNPEVAVNEVPESAEVPTEVNPEATTATTEGEAAPIDHEAEKAKAEAAKAEADKLKADTDASVKSFQDKLTAMVGTPPNFKGTDEQPVVAGTVNPGNGESTEEEYAALVEAFKSVLGGTKSVKRIMDDLQVQQRVALIDHSWPVGARAYALIGQRLADAAKGGPKKAAGVAKPVLTPTQTLQQQAATFLAACSFLQHPEADADWAGTVQGTVAGLSDEIASYRAYLAELDAYNELADEEKAKVEAPTAPEVDEIVIAAARLARGRSATKVTKAPSTPRAPKGEGTPRTPKADGEPRGNILEHIKEVFADQPIGTFLKVGEITKVETRGYAAGTASGGAITARISKENWSEVCPSLEYCDSPKGLTKIA